MLLTGYRIATYLLSPAIDLYLWLRRRRGKEDAERFEERAGIASIPRPKGSLVWVHAASVGESLSVLPMIEKMLAAYPDLTLLVTTGTVSSAKMLESRLPARAFHQYVPVDRIYAVHRFLAHWRPNLALWVESELWPNLVVETHALGCPIVLLNARMSQNSFDKWRRAEGFAREMLQCFTLIFPQSEEDAARFKRLGAMNVLYLGNLKSDAPPLPADPKETGQLLAMIESRPVWLAASTHPGEELMLAKAHLRLKEKYPEILTIIVPRHAPRGGEIATLLRGQKLKVAQRSKQEKISPETDIYLADTMGELGLFYRLTPIVFMGGSLVDHGGQNPLEAARLGCAIVYGPFMTNFSAVCRDLEEEKASVRVAGAESLTEVVGALLTDHARQEALAEAARRVVEGKRGVMDAVLGALDFYLSTLSRKADKAQDDVADTQDTME